MYRVYLIDKEQNVKIYHAQFETFESAWKRYTEMLEIGTYKLSSRTIKIDFDSIQIVFEEPKYIILN